MHILAKPYASFLHKNNKLVASSLTAAISRASISSRKMFSTSLDFGYTFASNLFVILVKSA